MLTDNLAYDITKEFMMAEQEIDRRAEAKPEPADVLEASETSHLSEASESATPDADVVPGPEGTPGPSEVG